MKALRVLGIIIFVASILIGVPLYFLSFALWVNLIGFWGYLVSSMFVPDFVLLIIRIVQHGFLDWYVLYLVGDTILLFIGLMLSGIGKEE
jgi:hypothetical protein